MASIAEKLKTIADNTVAIYEKGKADCTEEGAKAEYNRFWDSFQDNGNRTDYGYGFAGKGWTNDTFKPKYPIIAVGDASYMFNNSNLKDCDFVEQGIDIDLSGVTSATYMFRNAKGIIRLGTIDLTGCKDINRFLWDSGVQTIDNFIVTESLKWDNTFASANNLVNISITGTIGQTGLSFSNSKNLSHDSIVSVINHLSTSTSGLAVTFSKTAVNKAFETSAGANDGSTSAEWLALVGTRSNWTISLA